MAAHPSGARRGADQILPDFMQQQPLVPPDPWQHKDPWSDAARVRPKGGPPPPPPAAMQSAPPAPAPGSAPAYAAPPAPRVGPPPPPAIPQSAPAPPPLPAQAPAPAPVPVPAPAPPPADFPGPPPASGYPAGVSPFSAAPPAPAPVPVTAHAGAYQPPAPVAAPAQAPAQTLAQAQAPSAAPPPLPAPVPATALAHAACPPPPPQVQGPGPPPAPTPAPAPPVQGPAGHQSSSGFKPFNPPQGIAGRYYHADFEVYAGEKMGLQLGYGEYGALVVKEVKEHGVAATRWNSRCSATYPEDRIRVADYLLTVGKTDNASMYAELKKLCETGGDMFLVLWRPPTPP
mmetsp:Transcript_49347/g.106239  ORF Transcript_49347/g.106239 Transcript_49347/m.106239 type:complete len:344 (-) Transcript_49347:104-1135(-)